MAVFCICIVSNVHAKSARSLVSFGINCGEISETLDTKYSALSRLNWKEPVFISVGFSEEITFFNFISIFGLNFSIPNEWGIMQDYDYYMSGSVSQYSEHCNHLDKDFSFCIDLGYKFRIDRFSIIPFICGRFQSRKYSAWDGFIQIPDAGKSFTGNEEKKNIVGNGISYEQSILLPFIKLQVDYDFNSDMSISGNINYSPYFFSNCIDTHYFRSKQFTDEIRGGFCIGGEVNFYYKHFGVYFAYEYLKSSADAKTYKCNIGVEDPTRVLIVGYTPGIECSVWSIGCTYKFE